MITLYGSVRLGNETRELSGEGDTYERAKAALLAQVPEGATLLGLSRWPC